MRCPQVNRDHTHHIGQAYGLGPYAGEWCPYRGWTDDYAQHLNGRYGTVDLSDEESMVPWAHTDLPGSYS